MSVAGSTLLDNMAKQGKCSFATAPAYKAGWHHFSREAKIAGINRMEHIDRDFVLHYGKLLAEDVINGELKASTAQGYLSAVNRVMSSVRLNWKSVSAVQECLIPKREFVRTSAPIRRELYELALTKLPNRYKALYSLCREFGLRSKEAALLDVRKALREAREKNAIYLSKGTKGGRDRTIPLCHRERQIAALELAIEQLDKRDTTLVPFDKNFAQYKHGEMRVARETLEELTGATGLHELRAAYACERYKELTGYDAPCVAGFREAAKEIDIEARLTIAEELGHGRYDVTVAYLGSSK